MNHAPSPTLPARSNALLALKVVCQRTDNVLGRLSIPVQEVAHACDLNGLSGGCGCGG